MLLFHAAPLCPPGQFRCGDGETCLNLKYRCDGKVDCPNDDLDEKDCRKYDRSIIITSSAKSAKTAN